MHDQISSTESPSQPALSKRYLHGLSGDLSTLRSQRCYFCWLVCVVVEVALACKIQVQIWAIFGSWYKYGQSGASRQSSQREHFTISTYPSQKQKAQLLREKSSVQIWKKWPRGIKRTNGRERTMNMQPTLPSSSGHLQKVRFSQLLRSPRYERFCECHKFLDTFFTTLTTRCSYN